MARKKFYGGPHNFFYYFVEAPGQRPSLPCPKFGTVILAKTTRTIRVTAYGVNTRSANVRPSSPQQMYPKLMCQLYVTYVIVTHSHIVVVIL